jgi:hypothetical protein
MRRQPGVSTVTEDDLRKTTEDYPFPPKEIERLINRRKILRFAKLVGVGAEIGVFRGHFAEVLVQALMPKRLYLVDPWSKQGEFFNLGFGPTPYTCDGTLPTAVARREVELRMARFPAVKVTMLEGYFSEEAAKIKERLDWIYIDGNHQYEEVLKDLYTARGLLKPDGVILGDDWRPNPTGNHHGVFRAVQEFTRKTKYQIIAAAVAGQYCLARAPDYDNLKDAADED